MPRSADKPQKPKLAKFGERCLDCELREHPGAGPTLDSMGRPRRHPKTGVRLTLNCEGCGGTGRA